MRPVGGAAGMAMLHRVVMNVIDVTLQVRLVADRVFPKAGLPDAVSGPGRGWPFMILAARERALDEAPADRIVGIAAGERPYAVQMLREYRDRNRCERAEATTLAERGTQRVDAVGQQRCLTIGKRDREKVRATGDEIAAIA